MKSLVVIVRNYAQVWYKFKFRWQRGLKRRGKNLPSTTPDEVLEEFAGEYLEPLKAVLKLPPAKKLVVYFEEILEAEGTLPESLLQLWEVPAQELVNVSRAERIEQLRKIGQGCDEFDADCDAVNCRSFAANLRVLKCCCRGTSPALVRMMNLPCSSKRFSGVSSGAGFVQQ